MLRLILAVAWPVFAALASAVHAEGLGEKLDDIARRYFEKQGFMGAVLVARGDQVLIEKGYGFANVEWKVPNMPDTRFRIGSLTKEFTAAAILLLEERGLLKVEDKVSKYVKNLPPGWDRITIYNLLTHTSGIEGYTELPDYVSWQGLHAEPRDLFLRIRDKPLKFEPGVRMEYSNSNYLLLGALIETLSHQRYGDFLRENIFNRLGMKDTGYFETKVILARRASGYNAVIGGPMVNAPHIDMSVAYAAGGLYSTTHDLFEWQRALFGGRVLSKPSLEKMLKPFKSDFAMGLIVTKPNGVRLIGHSGGIPGFASILAYLPDSKIVVIILANVELGNAAGQLSQELIAAVR